jgi:L-ascorbate metabolism protein UlaG (beta-lactamase superfamily)
VNDGPLAELKCAVVGPGQLGLLWLGQSGFALRLGGTTVLIDAFLSPHPDRLVAPALRPDTAAGLDVIACTHEHWDHLDLPALPALAAASPAALVLVPTPIVEMVTACGIAADRVVGLEPGRPWARGALTVHAVPARHGVHVADAYTFGEDRPGGAPRFLGYVLDAGGVRVYHAGDTIGHEGLAAALRALAVDVALLPVNGRDAAREARDIVGNLDPVEAAVLAAAAGARVVVPMHHDMFAANPGHPERLVEAVVRHHPDLTVVLPARGRTVVVG